MEIRPDKNDTGTIALTDTTAAGGELELSGVIERIRRRWRLRLLADGLLWTLALGTLLVLASAWLLNAWHFTPEALWSLRLITLFALAALVYQFCVKPLRRRAGDLRVALYLEEHEPELESVVHGAVDARRAQQDELSAQLVEQLEQRALEACAAIEYGDRVERRGLRLAGTRLGAALLAIAALAIWPPSFLQNATPALAQPWAPTDEVSPYQIELEPGDIEIRRGDDQLISAYIAGFDGDDVLLHTSVDDGASWQQTPMVRDGDNYQSFLFDVAQHTDYYVTGAGRQTPTHRIAVTAIPAIESIALRYHFPDYTLLPPESSYGSGDITALRGTRVEVVIESTIEIPGGALHFVDGREIALRQADDGSWIGELIVRQDDAYHVILQRASGIPVNASLEYRIVALGDRLPNVSITSPGRDTRVSIIEEPELRVKASDDQGIARLELVLSVNGEAEQRIDMMPAKIDTPADEPIEASHVIYLEDLGLRPGDLISYYVHAEDRAPAGEARKATSDIFFYQVRPFRKNYRNAEQQGGGGGGGGQGGEQQGQLSEQQKQFVVATFKMIRDRNTYTEEAYKENLELLARAQARIRDRVEAIIRRLGSRSVMHQDITFKEIIEALPPAVEAMHEVEHKLQHSDIDAALTDAQVALKYLQRADAAFRDFNISLANRGGGGAGRNTGSEDLANLFQLEMDKLRHQYETVQRGAQQQAQPNEVIDETLEKLRELARRQQQEVERAMRRQGQAGGNASNRDQLALAEELEEMARQLEKLSRNQPNPQLQQSVEQMRNAAQAMRRAAENSGANGGSATNDGGASDARQAARDLAEARRLLDQGRVRQFSEQVERSLRRAEMAERKQARIQQDLTELEQSWGSKLHQQLERLEEKKQELSKALSDLESDLSRLSAEAREEQPEANQAIKQAIRAGREHRLHDRIGRTRNMYLLEEHEAAFENESKIREGIGEIRKHIENALDSVGEQDSRGLARSMEELRALSRELSYLRERAAANDAGENANPGDAGQDNPGDNTNPGAAQRNGPASSANAGSAARGGPGGSANAGSARRDGQGIFDAPTARNTLDDFNDRARELGGVMVDQGVAPGDLEPALKRIEALTGAGNDSPATLAAYDEALRALMMLEFELRNRDQAEYPDLLISEPGDLPDEYRDMVADYYRKLSEQ